MKSLNQVFLPISKDDNILVAVSGGADSMALLHFLIEKSKKNNSKISAAHLNHGIRRESDDDEKLVRDFCQENNVDYYSKKVDLEDRIYHGLSLEEAGRKARYDFFKELIEEHHFNKLLTAHHLDDQAETLLMRIIRGTGPKGICGIQQKSDFYGIELLRPFLSIPKVEILNYCHENDIPYALDSTNESNEFTRNLIRNSIIPQFKQIVPSASEKIANLAQLQTREQSFLSQILDKIAEKCLTVFDDGIRIESELYTNPTRFLHNYNLEFLDEEAVIFLQSELIRVILDRLDGLEDLSFEHVEKIRNHFINSTSGYIELPDGKKAYKSSGICEIINSTLSSKDFDYSAQIESESKVYYFSKNRLKLTTKTGKALNHKRTYTNDSALLKRVQNKKFIFRKRQPGDVVFLKGMNTKKKLARFFIDKKVPLRIRDSIPVLACENEIIWIPGLYIHRDYLVTSEDDQTLFLELKRI